MNNNYILVYKPTYVDIVCNCRNSVNIKRDHVMFAHT